MPLDPKQPTRTVKKLKPTFLRLENVEESVLEKILALSDYAASELNSDPGFVGDSGPMQVEVLPEERIKVLKSKTEKKRKRQETARKHAQTEEQIAKRKARASSEEALEKKRKLNERPEEEKKADAEAKAKAGRVRRRSQKLLKREDFDTWEHYMKLAKEEIENEINKLVSEPTEQVIVPQPQEEQEKEGRVPKSRAVKAPRKFTARQQSALPSE